MGYLSSLSSLSCIGKLCMSSGSSVLPASIWSHASKGGTTQNHCADSKYYPRYLGTPDATPRSSESLWVTRLSGKAGSDGLISGNFSWFFTPSVQTHSQPDSWLSMHGFGEQQHIWPGSKYMCILDIHTHVVQDIDIDTDIVIHTWNFS